MKRNNDFGKILEILRKYYPNAKTSLNYTNPLELMVATMLSAQCTDKRVNIVTKDLFVKYKSVQDYANSNNLALDIKSINFFNNKAKNIKQSCIKIISEFKGEVPSTMEELTSLPGISRKTANVILYNSFCIVEGIVVDTHVLRISSRLKLTFNKDPKKVEHDLMRIFPRNSWGNLSNLFISLGRDICKARSPQCLVCPLGKTCPSFMNIKT